MSIETRISELRREGEAAIAAAATTRRTRGRARPVPGTQGRAARTCCAVSPSCRPSSAAPSARPPMRHARRSRRRSTPRPASSPSASSTPGSQQDRVDVTLPADPLPAVGRLHLITQTRREIEDVFIGLGFNVAEGPEVETRLLQLRRAQPRRRRTRRGPGPTPSHRRSDRRAAAHAHEPDADPRDGAAEAADLHHRPGPRLPAATRDVTHTPQFHQIEGLAVDEGITLTDLKGTLLDVRARDLRPRA